mmetsp:Transcript_59128/g.97744  ORF Transcript_59128/g.97744 Transcript_59128/m.97744 type:complete len:256 (+) Transcript_59128:30-797(+)
MEPNIKQIPLPNGFCSSLDKMHGEKDLKELGKLVFGFLRKIETTCTYSMPMPSEIKCICVDYSVEKYATFFTIYDAARSTIDEVKDNTHPHHQILKGLKVGSHARGDIIFLSPIELNEGIHFVTVKCVKGHPNDKFGLVENADLETLPDFGKLYLYDAAFKNKFYWWRHTKQIWTEKFDQDGEHNSKNFATKDGKQWEHGDVLKMRIDCEQWKVEFFRNDASVQEVDIEPQKTYYAALSNGSNGCEYHHLLDAQQ